MTIAKTSAKSTPVTRAKATLAKDTAAEKKALAAITAQEKRVIDQFDAARPTDAAAINATANDLFALGQKSASTQASFDARIAHDKKALGSAEAAEKRAAAAAKAKASRPGPWQSGPGYGISMRDMGANPKGNSVFIAYAGYNVSMGEAQSWAQHLYDAKLKALGVRYVYAVQGPRDPSYAAQEIGNSKLAARLVGQASKAKSIIVVGHSSGTFVADELLHQLANGADPRGATRNKVVYFNLDGGQEFDASGIERTRRTYYISAHDHRTGTVGPNWSTMEALGSEFRNKGGFHEFNATADHLASGAEWALHTSLITTRPHSRFTGSPIDYGDWSGGRHANHAWLDPLIKDAGL